MTMADYTENDVKRILEEIRREYEEAHRREEDSEDFEFDEDDDVVLVDVEEQKARSAAASGTLDELIAWARGSLAGKGDR